MVACKRISLKDSDECVKDLLIEAKIVMSLRLRKHLDVCKSRHACVIAFIGIIIEDNTPAIVMELLECGTLEEYVQLHVSRMLPFELAVFEVHL